MLLKFDAAKAVDLVKYTERATHHRSMNGLKEGAVPCLWLMGDHGLCLTSSGLPTPCCDDFGEPSCLFAVGGSPEDGFDKWWPLKQAAMGEAPVAYIPIPLAKSAIKGSWMAFEMRPHGDHPLIKAAEKILDNIQIPWTSIQSQKAVRQGWNIVDGRLVAINPRDYRGITRHRKPKFESNDGAAAWVKEMARQGNDTAIYAISVLSSIGSPDVVIYGLRKAMMASHDNR